MKSNLDKGDRIFWVNKHMWGWVKKILPNNMIKIQPDSSRNFFEVPAIELVKTAMPHFKLKDFNKSVDFFFELMTPKERQEVYYDLIKKKHKIKLPDDTIDISMLDDQDFVEEFIKRYLHSSGSKKTDPIYEYDEKNHKYKKIKSSENFVEKIYTFNDIPEKRKYIFDRVKKIYNDIDDSVINQIFDNIKMLFRKQNEKGASNHLKRTIYISLNELNKYDLDDREKFLKYLNHPKSIITHETTHIFQNIFKVFPHIKYLKKDNGKWVIDYKKYVTDKGEIQSRIEQVIELLNWGFTDDEIVEFLYNRKYQDKNLWRELINEAKKIKKLGSSKLPGIDDDENVTNEQGRLKKDYQQKDLGKNYERDYLSSGHERDWT